MPMEKPGKPFFRLIDHTADLGMEIFGDDPADLFVNAARALFAVLAQADGRGAAGRRRHTIDLEGADWADLMVNWLRELLYLWNGEQQVLSGLEIQSLSENRLRAEVITGDVDPRRHRAGQEIKAVTYHQIAVGPGGQGWRARVIFDL
jgi:SHS2 domain-containing protein